MALSGLISCILSGLSVGIATSPAISHADVTDFHCGDLTQSVFAEHGLPGVSEMSTVGDTVCQTHYRGDSIVISSAKSQYISQLRNSQKFKTSHYRLGHYDILITAPHQQNCTQVIINHKQLITVISPVCALTRKTVSIIVRILE